MEKFLSFCFLTKTNMIAFTSGLKEVAKLVFKLYYWENLSYLSGWHICHTAENILNVRTLWSNFHFLHCLILFGTFWHFKYVIPCIFHGVVTAQQQMCKHRKKHLENMAELCEWKPLKDSCKDNFSIIVFCQNMP